MTAVCEKKTNNCNLIFFLLIVDRFLIFFIFYSRTTLYCIDFFLQFFFFFDISSFNYLLFSKNIQIYKTFCRGNLNLIGAIICLNVITVDKKKIFFQL